MRIAILVMLVLSGHFGLASAQEATQPDVLALRQSANSQLRGGEFGDALKAFQRLTELNPFDGALWLGVGRSAMGLGQHAAAIDAYRKAMNLGAGHDPGNGFRSNVNLEIARAAAQLGDDETVYQAIEAALANRLTNPGVLFEDAAFGRFQDQARFQQLMGLPTDTGLSRDDGWRFDIGLLERIATRMHVNPDGPPVPVAFTDRLAKLRDQVSSLSDSELFMELMGAVALLGDGHCSVYPGPTSQIPMTRLPIDVYVFEDGLFIVDGQGDASQWIGSEILEFDGKSPGQVMDALADYLPRDNPMGLKSFGPFMMTIPAAIHHVGVARQPDQVTLKLRLPDQTVQDLVLRGDQMRMTRGLPVLRKPRDQRPLAERNPEANYWYQSIPDSHTVFLQFNRVIEDPANPIETFLAELRESLHTTQAKDLIVDVRRNGGGNAFFNREFVRTLVHFELASPDHRVYVLQGRHTFSAAQNLVTQIDRMTNAIFVGEPSGSRPNHIGEDSMMQLPHSGLIASISSRYFQDSDPTDDRIWIAPDIVVPIESDDYFSGRDLAMALVLNRIRSERNQE